MKNLQNFGKTLSKKEQQTIKGGGPRQDCESGGGTYTCEYISPFLALCHCNCPDDNMA